MGGFFSGILGWVMTLTYLFALLKITDFLMDKIKKRTDDFFLITIPTWLIVFLSSSAILFIFKLFPQEITPVIFLIEIILYTSVSILSISFVSLILIRPLNKKLYEKIIHFIRHFKFKK